MGRFCKECKHLNYTDKEQHTIHIRTGHMHKHVCTKYDQLLNHHATSVPGVYTEHLLKCAKCLESTKLKYAVYPGWMQSCLDGTMHWVGAETIMGMYKVKKVQCMIMDIENCKLPEEAKELIPLYPRYDDEYSLPKDEYNRVKSAEFLEKSKQRILARSEYESQHVKVHEISDYINEITEALLTGNSVFTTPDVNWFKLQSE